ncbi:MAG: MFS transporter [Pseudomonadota bacterium]
MTTDVVSDDVSQTAGWPRESYGWYVVFVLCVCGIVAFIDRQIINLLVEDIKTDLGVTDVQISLLQGLAFASFYATVAVPLGRLADSVNRRTLIAVAIVLWTFAAIGCGLADSYGELFVARMFIGIGEAVLTPAGFSLLADYFRPQRISLPVSVFTGSSFFGSGIALLAGGALIAYLAGLDALVFPLVGELRPWQAAFIIGALPGFVVAVWFFLTVKEPERRSNPQLAAGAELRTGFVQALAYIKSHGRMFTGIFFGLSLAAAANFSMGAWVPAFFIRVHGWEASQIGFAYGWLFLFCGSGGVIAGGWLANWLHARGYADANLRTPLLGVLLAVPFALAFTQVESPRLAIVLMVPLMIFATLPFGAGSAVLPIVTPTQFRAQLVAIYLLIANFVGQAGGPWVVALLTDKVFGDPTKVGNSITITVGALLLMSAAFLTLGLRPLNQLLTKNK